MRPWGTWALDCRPKGFSGSIDAPSCANATGLGSEYILSTILPSIIESKHPRRKLRFESSVAQLASAFDCYWWSKSRGWKFEPFRGSISFCSAFCISRLWFISDMYSRFRIAKWACLSFLRQKEVSCVLEKSHQEFMFTRNCLDMRLYSTKIQYY